MIHEYIVCALFVQINAWRKEMKPISSLYDTFHGTYITKICPYLRWFFCSRKYELWRENTRDVPISLLLSFWKYLKKLKIKSSGG